MTELRVIHKVQMSQAQTSGILGLPKGSTIVGAAFQHYALSIWYERDPNEFALEQWQFQIVGTGHRYEEGLPYLAGPLFMNSVGDFVFHLLGKRLDD